MLENIPSPSNPFPGILFPVESTVRDAFYRCHDAISRATDTRMADSAWYSLDDAAWCIREASLAASRADMPRHDDDLYRAVCRMGDAVSYAKGRGDSLYAYLKGLGLLLDAYKGVRRG